MGLKNFKLVFKIYIFIIFFNLNIFAMQDSPTKKRKLSPEEWGETIAQDVTIQEPSTKKTKLLLNPEKWGETENINSMPEDAAKISKPKIPGSHEEALFLKRLDDFEKDQTSLKKFEALRLVAHQMLIKDSSFIRNIFSSLFPINIRKPNDSDFKKIGTLASPVNSIKINPKFPVAVVLSGQGQIDLVDLEKEKLIDSDIKSKLNNTPVITAEWSPQGDYIIVSVGQGGFFGIGTNFKTYLLSFNSSTKKFELKFNIDNNLKINSLSWSPDGKKFVSVGQGSVVKFWEIVNDSIKFVSNFNINSNIINYLNIDLVSWNPYGNFILISADKDFLGYDVTDLNKPVKKFDKRFLYNTEGTVSWISKEILIVCDGIGLLKTDYLKPNFYGSYLLKSELFSASLSIKKLINFRVPGFVLAFNRLGISLWDLSQKKDSMDNLPEIFNYLVSLKGLLTASAKSSSSILFGSHNGAILICSKESDLMRFLGSLVELKKDLVDLPKTKEGMKVYLLIKEIMEFHQKFVSGNPRPFSISYPKVKALYHKIPLALKTAMLNKKYVEIKKVV